MIGDTQLHQKDVDFEAVETSCLDHTFVDFVASVAVGIVAAAVETAYRSVATVAVAAVAEKTAAVAAAVVVIAAVVAGFGRKRLGSADLDWSCTS